MRFEAELNLTYRQLLALYTVSERVFRWKQMLLFRVVCLAVGVWRTWSAWNQITANGAGFRNISYLMIGALFLTAALIPNIVSAGFARMRVLYRGKLVELAPTAALYGNPLHPYTRVLLSAIPIPDPIAERNRPRIDFETLSFDLSGELREAEPGHYVLSKEAGA